MNRLLTLLLIVLQASPGVAADPASPSGTDDNKLLNGKWTPIAAIIGGIKLPAEELTKITLTLSGDTYEVAVLGEDHVDRGTAIRDTTTTPKRLTIRSLEGPNKGKTFLAIYEIKTVNGVDAYRVCYDLSGAAFPTEFKSVKGSQLYLAGYRRKKE